MVFIKNVLRVGSGAVQPVSGVFVQATIKYRKENSEKSVIAGSEWSETKEWRFKEEISPFDPKFVTDEVIEWIGDMGEAEHAKFNRKVEESDEKEVYEVVVHRITEEVPCSPIPDGGAQIRVLSDGEPRTAPSDFAKVTVAYSLVLSSSGEEIGVADGLEFRVGCYEVPPGLDLAVRQMRKGSSAVVKLRPQYAFGPYIFPPPPKLGEDFPDHEALCENRDSAARNLRHFEERFAGQCVEYRNLFLKEVKNLPKPWSLETDTEKLAYSAEMQRLGSDLLRQRFYTVASKAYEAAKEALLQVSASPEADKRAQANEALGRVLLETSYAYFPRKLYAKSLDAAKEAAKLQVKATDPIWQQARCLRMLENLELAMSTILMAFDMKDKTSDLTRLEDERRRIRAAQAKVEKESASLWKGTLKKN